MFQTNTWKDKTAPVLLLALLVIGRISSIHCIWFTGSQKKEKGTDSPPSLQRGDKHELMRGTKKS